MSFCRVDVKVCVVAVPRDSNLAIFRIDVGQRILHDFNRDEPAHLLIVGVDNELAILHRDAGQRLLHDLVHDEHVHPLRAGHRYRCP